MCKISVCMATFNGEKFIKEQLDSILILLGDTDEVIISDDGSTDRTIDIINNYNDSRIKIYKNDNKPGVIGNFENSISKSKGDYIFLSDQDDVWLKDKVSKVIHELQNVDLVVTDAFLTNEKGEKFKESYYYTNKTKPGLINNIINASYLGCTMAFKKDIKSYILPFPSRIPMHDLWIGSMVYLKGKVKFMDDKLILYRRHDNNVSFSGEKSEIPIMERILFRIRLVGNILRRFLIN